MSKKVEVSKVRKGGRGIEMGRDRDERESLRTFGLRKNVKMANNGRRQMKTGST